MRLSMYASYTSDIGTFLFAHFRASDVSLNSMKSLSVLRLEPARFEERGALSFEDCASGVMGIGETMLPRTSNPSGASTGSDLRSGSYAESAPIPARPKFFHCTWAQCAREKTAF